MLLAALNRRTHQFAPPTGSSQENAAIMGNIEKHERPRHSGHQPLLSRKIYCRQIAIQPTFGRREPNFASIG